MNNHYQRTNVDRSKKSKATKVLTEANKQAREEKAQMIKDHIIFKTPSISTLPELSDNLKELEGLPHGSVPKDKFVTLLSQHKDVPRQKKKKLRKHYKNILKAQYSDPTSNADCIVTHLPIPRTATQIQQAEARETYDLIQGSQVLLDVNDDMYLMYVRHIFAPIALDEMKAALEVMMSELFGDIWTDVFEKAKNGQYIRVPEICNDNRGQSFVVHLGKVRHYTKDNIQFVLTSHPAVRKMLTTANLFFKTLEKNLHQRMPKAMQYLASSPAIKNKELELLFAGFPSMAIVFGASEKDHIDTNDSRNILGCSVPVGDWEGCNMLFPTIKKEVAFRAGDLLAFRTHELRHKTAPIIRGCRFSCVFYADHNLFTAQ